MQFMQLILCIYANCTIMLNFAKLDTDRIQTAVLIFQLTDLISSTILVTRFGHPKSYEP